MSAPRPGALASIFSLEPGTERQERRGRLRERSDMGERRKAAPRSSNRASRRRGRRHARRPWMPERSRARSGGLVGRRPAARARRVRGAHGRRCARRAQARRRRRRSTSSAPRRRRRTARARLSGAARSCGPGASTRSTTSVAERLPGEPIDRPTLDAAPAVARARRRCSATSACRSAALGRRHGRRAWSTAASATASTTPMRTHSDRDARTARSAAPDRRRGRATSTSPTDDVVHFDFSPCERAVGDGDAHHGRRRLGGRDERRRGLRSRHARARTPTTAPCATRCSRAAAERTDPRVLPLYAAHMVLRQVDWSLRHHGRLSSDRGGTLDLGDRAVGRRSALGRVASMTTHPDAHAARARRRRVRVAAAGRRVGVSNAGVVVDDDGLTVIDTLMVRSQWEPFAAAVDRLGRPVRRILLTHAHIDHVGGTHGVPERDGARITADESAARRRDAARRVQGVHARVRRGVRRARRARHPTRHAPRHRRRVAHAAHRGAARDRPHRRRPAWRSSPTSTSCSRATSASSASRRSRSRATPRCGPTCSTSFAELADDDRARARAGRRRAPRSASSSSTSATASKVRSRPARGTRGPSATRATRSTSSGRSCSAAGRDEMPPAMLDALGFG